MHHVLMISSCCAIGDCFSFEDNKKRLPSVSLLGTEFDVLCESDFDNHSDDYDSRKARKVERLICTPQRYPTVLIMSQQLNFFDLTFLAPVL